MMMSDREIRRVLKANLEANGYAVELIKLMEECGELVRAAARLTSAEHVGGDLIEQLAEEMADVEICMEQARMMFTGLRDSEDAWIDIKVARLGERLMPGGDAG